MKRFQLTTVQRAEILLISLIVIYYVLEITSLVILARSGELKGEILNIKAFNLVFFSFVFWFLLKSHPAARWTIIVTGLIFVAEFLSSSAITFLTLSLNKDLVLIESQMIARLVTLPIELLFPVALLLDRNIKRFFEFKKSKWNKREISVTRTKSSISSPHRKSYVKKTQPKHRK